MLTAAALVALVVAIGVIVLAVRRHDHDDFGPSMRDYAAFRAALAATGRRRDDARA